MTIEQIVDVLELEEIPDSERVGLETLLEHRCTEALKKLSKVVSASFTANVKSVIDPIELYDKVRDTGSGDIEKMVLEILNEKFHDVFGANGFCHISLSDYK